MTLQRFVLRDQRRHPEAAGDFTNLLTSMLTAIKVNFPWKLNLNNQLKSLQISVTLKPENETLQNA